MVVVLEQQNNVGTVPMVEKNCCCCSCNSCCSFFLSQPSLTFQKRCVQKKFMQLILFTFLPFKCIETHLLLIKSQISTAFQLYLIEIYLKTLLPQVTLWLWFSEIYNKRKIFKSRFQNVVGPHSMCYNYIYMIISNTETKKQPSAELIIC